MPRWVGAVALGLLLGVALAASAARAEGRLVALLSPAELPSDDNFLQAAEQHHRADPQVRAIARLGSLAALHRWLGRQAEIHGPPDEIVLVGHGSAWTGAAIDLYQDGPRATASALRQARRLGSFPPLPDTVLGPRTRWRIDSCAVGRQGAWLTAFAALWQEGRPRPIEATEDFVVYQQFLDQDGQLHSRRFRSAVRIEIEARVGPQQAVHDLLLADEACAPLPAPCERRVLPIRFEYRAPAGSTAPRRPQRPPSDPALDQALADANLRARQLRWRTVADPDGLLRWVGEGTARLWLPPRTGWRPPELSTSMAAAIQRTSP